MHHDLQRLIQDVEALLDAHTVWASYKSKKKLVADACVLRHLHLDLLYCSICMRAIQLLLAHTHIQLPCVVVRTSGWPVQFVSMHRRLNPDGACV